MAIKTVGFVGLGNMGNPMARRLAGAGFEVVAFDPSPDRREALTAIDKLQTVDRLADVTEAEAIILMLPNGRIVEDLLTGVDGILSALPAGTLIVDMSSSDPAIYSAIAKHLSERGLDMIDAPVSGNVSGAQAGTLSIMAGGKHSAIDKAMPLFSAIGQKTFHVGPLGSGQVIKALNNLLSAGGLMMAIEVLLVAKRAGLDPAQVTDILNVSTGRNNSTEKKVKPFILSGAFNSGFGLSLMAKDLRTAAAIAQEQGVTLPVSSRAIESANAAEKMLGNQADHTEVARWLEQVTGLSLSF